MLESLSGQEMRGIPRGRREFFNAIRRRMTDEDYQAAIDGVNDYIDQHDEFFVSSFIPGSDWGGTPFLPIWHAARHNYDHSRIFFGLVVWDAVANHRPGEQWVFMLADRDADDILGTKYWRPEER